MASNSFIGLTTTVISDAMDEMGLRGCLVGLKAVGRHKEIVVGRALPVKYQRFEEGSEGKASSYRFGGGIGRHLEAVLKVMQQGQMVLMDLGGSVDAAAWGGLASALATSKGVVGTVINGCCRDVEEIRGLEYPLWSVGVFPRRSRNKFEIGSVGDEINVCGVQVRPDDIVVGDSDGVVVIPSDRVQEVLDLASEISAREEEALRQISGGNVVNWDDV